MIRGNNVKHFKIKLDCGIKIPCLMKNEEKGNCIIVSTDRNVNAVVQYLQRRFDHHFEMLLFREHIFKRLKLRPAYKVVIEYDEKFSASDAEKLAVKILQKKVNEAVRRRLDYISDIFMDVRNSIQ